MEAAAEQESSRGTRRRKRAVTRRIGRALGLITLALVLVVGLTGMYLYRDLNGRINASTELTALETRAPVDPAAGRALNILVMGDDSRQGAGNDIDGTSISGGGSDTTILIHLSADRSRAYGISIPRDAMVDRPACPAHGRFKAVPAASPVQWNAAYAVGGAACTIAQFEAATDVHVDHFVVVDFNGMKKMVDAIGGVRMCIPFDLVDDGKEGTHTTIRAGRNRLLDGTASRAYVRMRHINGLADGSDLGRTRRQQAFIGAMAKQVLSAGTLTNPLKVTNFLRSTLESLTVDAGLGNITDMANLAVQFKDIGLDDIQFLTIPVVNWPQDPNRVMFSEPNAGTIWTAIRKDRQIPKRLLTGVLRADGQIGVPTGKKPQSSAGASPSAPGTATPDATPTPSATPSIKDAVPATMYDDPERLGLCS